MQTPTVVVTPTDEPIVEHQIQAFNMKAMMAKFRNGRIQPTSKGYINNLKNVIKKVYKTTDDKITYEQLAQDDVLWAYIETAPHNDKTKLAHAVKLVWSYTTDEMYPGASEIEKRIGKGLSKLMKKVKEDAPFQPLSGAMLEKLKIHPNMASIERLRDVWNGYRLEDPSDENTLGHMLLCIYTMMVVPRDSELMDCLLTESGITEERNHYNIEKKELVLYDHKNGSRTGMRRVNVPDELRDIIVDAAQFLKTKWLVPSKLDTDVAMTVKQYGPYINKITGVGGCQFLRQLDAARVWQNGTREDIARHAEQAGHSMETAFKDYGKAYAKWFPRKDDAPIESPVAVEVEPIPVTAPVLTINDHLAVSSDALNAAVVKLSELVDRQDEEIDDIARQILKLQERLTNSLSRRRASNERLNTMERIQEMMMEL